MKKIVLLGGICSTLILLSGCGNQTSTSTEIPTTTTTTATTQDQSSLSSNTTSMCATTVKEYLAKADRKGKTGKSVKKGDKVVVHYIGRLDDETVFDTSVEEVAKACGKYMSGRDYTQGLSFQVGAGQMILGFDKGVEGMNIGQTKTIDIAAKDAYGERSDKNVVKVPREQIPNAEQLKKGMKVFASNEQSFTVYAIDDKEVTLDANHELAGKKLIFDITVTEIQ